MDMNVEELSSEAEADPQSPAKSKASAAFLYD
jgi:hypothetical protein